jgi:hypothetical protein
MPRVIPSMVPRATSSTVLRGFQQVVKPQRCAALYQGMADGSIFSENCAVSKRSREHSAGDLLTPNGQLAGRSQMHGHFFVAALSSLRQSPETQATVRTHNPARLLDSLGDIH